MNNAKSVKVCPGCGNEDELHKRVCEKCGRQYQSQGIIEEAEKKLKERTVCIVKKENDEKFCGECGSVIKAKAEICPKCGVRQMAVPGSHNVSSTPGSRSRIAAALFAIFLGAFGAHKFYLGQIGWGFIYLIFFWTWIPAIIAFIEFILYLVMSDEEFNKKYNRNA